MSASVPGVMGGNVDANDGVCTDEICRNDVRTWEIGASDWEFLEEEGRESSSDSRVIPKWHATRWRISDSDPVHLRHWPCGRLLLIWEIRSNNFPLLSPRRRAAVTTSGCNICWVIRSWMLWGTGVRNYLHNIYETIPEKFEHSRSHALMYGLSWLLHPYWLGLWEELPYCSKQCSQGPHIVLSAVDLKRLRPIIPMTAELKMQLALHLQAHERSLLPPNWNLPYGHPHSHTSVSA